MLCHLYIKNYALIESLDIDFHKGFSVITGETGAGKSIILGALSLLLGERADIKAIKPGEGKCIIEAVYDISQFSLKKFFDENELEYQADECIIRRELSGTGKTRAFINDTPVSVTTLKALGNQLVDIHSQHQNLLLNDKKFQLKILDTVAHDEKLLSSYTEAYNQYPRARHELEHFETSLQQKRDKNDYQIFQLQEIDKAQLRSGEQEELEEEAKILDNAGEIKEALYKTDSMLSDETNGIVSRLNNCVNLLESLSKIYGKASSLAERLNTCAIEADDIRTEISQLLYHVNFDPERQTYVNDRLDLINALEDKYHKANIQELLDFAESLRHDIEINADSDETLRHLREQRDDCHRRAFDLAGKVSSARQSVIDKVEKEVIDNLTDLGMPKIRFKIQHDRQEELGSTGIDVVTFLFSANSSMPLQNLASTASGGEIARVMLSLKAILASSSQMRTIIFDEIDTGVSGCIAERMAVVMKNISNNNNQVISITHLPQIAAKGDYHYLVYKQDDGIVSLTNIKELNQEERVNEIAHMLSGADTTEAAINNAQALLDS